MLKITREQLEWVSSQGDRKINEVFEDEDGPYVMMGDGLGGEKKVYIPV